MSPTAFISLRARANSASSCSLTCYLYICISVNKQQHWYILNIDARVIARRFTDLVPILVHPGEFNIQVTALFLGVLGYLSAPLHFLPMWSKINTNRKLRAKTVIRFWRMGRIYRNLRMVTSCTSQACFCISNVCPPLPMMTILMTMSSFESIDIL